MSDVPPAPFKIALADHQAGRLDAAAAGYAQILHDNPDHLEAATNLAVLLHDRGQTADAIPLFEQALRLRPEMTEAHYILALCLMQSGDNEKARTHFGAAAEAASADSRPCVGLAALALKEGDDDAALTYADAALARAPDDADAWNLKGAACKELGRFADAHAAYDRALASQPDHAEARYNRGVLRLLLGDMPGGWDDYAWRWQGDGRQMPGADLGLPIWDGAPMPGGRLLVVAEQGFGDTLQCLRYLPLLHERGIEVAVHCRPTLRRLVETLPHMAGVCCPGEPPLDGNAYLPMMDLPRLFQTREIDVPAADGYLAAKPGDGIADKGARNVGLVWAGSPTHENDARRSVPLNALRPLLEVRDCQYFSLQVGERRDDLIACGMGEEIEDLSPAITDFADTAAMIAALDLVICVDTAVAHLAGALGRPAWVMLPFVPDWRWQLDRRDSPWYASLRLFRQPKPGDWGAVVDEIAHQLQP